MRVGEGACHALIAHPTNTHQRPRDLSDLERTLDLPVPLTVALEIQKKLALVGELLAVAHDEVLLPTTPIGLRQERAIARGVSQVHDVLAAA